MTTLARWFVVAIGTCALSACAPTGTPTPAAATPSPAIAITTPSSTAATLPSQSVVPAPSPAALPHGSEAIVLDPAQFAGVKIDHPFWPMAPGSRWVYRETDGEGAEQKVEVVVTDQTKQIIGITATVVHDVVSEDGAVIEDTFDWYAQDRAGNLWYLGEDTKEFENGEVASTEGSWQAGVDGAQPGLILPAEPAVGMTYRQEYYAGQAEDAAEVLSLDEHVNVPSGRYSGVLSTRDFTPLDPDMAEHKFYARGVGPVQVVQVSGGTSREELVSFKPS